MFLYTLCLSAYSLLMASPMTPMPSAPGTVSGAQGGSSTSSMPQTEAPATTDSCQSLINPKHIALASALTGNERILFCSIFDNAQRDQVLLYTQKKPPLLPKDAVIQVGKDNDLLFSSKPGGACGAH